MSIQRIDNPRGRTYGWQARAYMAPGKRLTRFFSDRVCGGSLHAFKSAVLAERSLLKRAKALRNVA